MNLLYWVRHGENPANLTKEFSCRHVDYPLTAKGRLQAEQTAAYFRGLPPLDALFCSPMRRTLETAQIIGDALGLAPVVVEELREIDVGELEGLPPDAATWARHDRVLAGWLDGRRDLAFPGGENYHTLERRMAAGLARLAGEGDGRRVLAVGHGGAFWVFLPTLCAGLDHATLGENHNCSITEVELWRGGTGLAGRLVRYADVGHLSGAAAQLVSGIRERDSRD